MKYPRWQWYWMWCVVAVAALWTMLMFWNVGTVAIEPSGFPKVSMERLDVLPDSNGVYMFEHDGNRVYVAVFGHNLKEATIAVVPAREDQ